MTAGGAVRIRPAPVLDEKQRQSLGRVGEVLVRIDGTQDRVAGDAGVEALDESPERRGAAHHFEYGHVDDDRVLNGRVTIGARAVKPSPAASPQRPRAAHRPDAPSPGPLLDR